MSGIRKLLKPFVLRSAAKLNLALQVTGHREDGFHTLNTVFERLDLADIITFSPSADECLSITCSHRAVPCDERNLVYKAAVLLREAAGIYKGAVIHIQKNIPVAAGLGGGSSNAATALLGLNRLWACGFSRVQLTALAKKIGSDVPFFLQDIPFAIGTDRGDKLKALAVAHRFWHVLITAKRPLLTKEVYRVYAERFLVINKQGLTKKTADVRMLARSLKQNDVARAQELVFNDLAGPIGVLRPELLKLKQRITEAARRGVCFSGSGPSIFALTVSQAEAERIAKIFRRSYAQVFVVRTA